LGLNQRVSFVVLMLCRLFGGLLSDVRRRYGYYRSDIVDGLNLQCFATIVFLYFACISPIVTFGGVLGQMTDDCMVSITPPSVRPFLFIVASCHTVHRTTDCITLRPTGKGCSGGGCV